MAPFLARGREPSLKGAFICGSAAHADNPRVTTLLATPFCRRQAGQRWPARLALALLALAALALSPAWSSDRRDHERVRAAVEAGQVLPLPTLLERLRRTHPGRVLELELEREHGRWRYEVKLLQPNGQLLKLEVDAATAQVLEAKRKDGPEHSPPAERDPGRAATPTKLPA